MRILNVTETYAPFLEFGGPPVKVRALSEGLARRGHKVTVLTADWGLENRLQAQEEKIAAERSPFGWRRNENGVQAIYLPTWMRYRTVSWNPAVKRYCRARLQNFDVVHIFVDRRAELKKHLDDLRGRIAPATAVWVSWPKKASEVPTDITEDTIRELALPIGFVDVKVCAVSEVWSGLKFVRRVKDR